MIAVEVESDDWLSLAEVETVARAAAEVTLNDSDAPAITGICILLTDDEVVADLNQRFRGKPGPTNVLSFPAAEQAAPLLGDLALAYGVCSREAREQGKSLSNHLSHLVVHGVLHLLGHDHLEDDEAEAMEGIERRVLARLGVADPYEDRA